MAIESLERFPHQLTVDVLKSGVKERGYVQIDFPLSMAEIRKKMDDFLSFLDLPAAEKKTTAYFSDQYRYSEGGYFARSKQDDGDSKEFFHYRPDTASRMGENLKRAPRETKKLLEVGDQVYRICEEQVRRVVGVLNDGYEDVYQKFFGQGDLIRSTLRFVKYDLDLQASEQLAQGHFDASGLTLAVAESAPGLRIAPNGQKEPLVEIVHRDKKAVFFPAKNLASITDPVDFPATFHDVIRKSVLDEDKRISRWALVFFAGYNGMPGEIRAK